MRADVEAAARMKAREYLHARGTLAPAAVVRERAGAAFSAFESFLAAAPAGGDVARPRPGHWTIPEIVDHVVETHRAALDELRCLLAGERPPGAPVPAGLQSKAPRLRPWAWLLREVGNVHRDIIEALESATDDAMAVRAPVVMVINVPGEGGETSPLEWIEELDWKAYAIVLRLHAIDHLNQAKRTLAPATAASGGV